MALQKQGSPFLYDEISGDIIGLRDADGGEGFILGALPCTWATRPTTDLFNGRQIFVTDVGEYGTVFMYSKAAGRWRPINGAAALKSMGAAIAGIGSTETIVLQAQLPAGVWQVNDVLRVFLAATKSGTTDSGNLSIRIGTGGTTSDTSVFSWSAALSAAAQSGGFLLDFKLASLTTVQKVGTGGSSNSWAAGISNAMAAATTVADASANALYVSATLASSGATNTAQAVSGSIELITP